MVQQLVGGTSPAAITSQDGCKTVFHLALTGVAFRVGRVLSAAVAPRVSVAEVVEARGLSPSSSERFTPSKTSSSVKER